MENLEPDPTFNTCPAWNLSGTFLGNGAFTATATNPYWPTACYEWFRIDVTIAEPECRTFAGTWTNPVASGPESGVRISSSAVTVVEANIETDRLTVVLGPAGTEGELEITLPVVTADGNTATLTLFSGSRPAGEHTFSFNRDQLLIGQYSTVDAVWSGAQGSRAVAFNVLGQYRHSQYNTPDESGCTGSQEDAYITDVQCTFQSTTLRSDFISQSWLNGSGIAIAFGTEQNEDWCLRQKKPRPPRDAEGRSFRPQPIVPSCGAGYTVSDTTVARGDNAPLNCGDGILLVGSAGPGATVKKTDTDRCPACTGEQIDNYTTAAACRPGSIPDLGNFTTIRLR
jgi:hypothetical protein